MFLGDRRNASSQYPARNPIPNPRVLHKIKSRSKLNCLSKSNNFISSIHTMMGFK